MSDELRVLVGDDDMCRVVDKATFDRLAVPINEKAERKAPPNPLLTALAHIRAAENLLSKVAYAVFHTAK